MNVLRCLRSIHIKLIHHANFAVILLDFKCYFLWNGGCWYLFEAAFVLFAGSFHCELGTEYVAELSTVAVSSTCKTQIRRLSLRRGGKSGLQDDRYEATNNTEYNNTQHKQALVLHNSPHCAHVFRAIINTLLVTFICDVYLSRNC